MPVIFEPAESRLRIFLPSSLYRISTSYIPLIFAMAYTKFHQRERNFENERPASHLDVGAGSSVSDQRGWPNTRAGIGLYIRRARKTEAGDEAGDEARSAT